MIKICRNHNLSIQTDKISSQKLHIVIIIGIFAYLHVKTQIMKKFHGQKIKTEIEGLDQLLFGGLYLNSPDAIYIQKPLSIAIYGDKGTSRALLAMQLLHGITKSLKQFTFYSQSDQQEIAFKEPLFYTDNKGLDNLSDMLLDMLTAKTITKLIERCAQKKHMWKSSALCNAIFDTRHPNNTFISLNGNQLDFLLGLEILIYDIHTNALHLAKPNKKNLQKDGIYEPIFLRKRLSVEEYMEAMRTACQTQDDELVCNFFDVKFHSQLQNHPRELCNYWGKDNEIIPCLVIDQTKHNSTDNVLLNLLKEKSFVTISISDEEPDRKHSSFDMIIELRRYEDNNIHYVFNQLCIKKSAIQDTAMGWHIFKKREHGFEVYPSTHVLLQKRRHMPRSILVSQYGVLEETYQHFMENQPQSPPEESVQNYMERQKSQERLTPPHKEYMDITKKLSSPFHILKNILMPSEHNSKAESTALIGPPNTFKRFLTLSSSFYASCKNIHTLNILLDKEDTVMFRKILCPACICNKKDFNDNEETKFCVECYNRIHLSNIRMGCISSEEFFFYLIKQIKISHKSENPIKRIVIDDLQKIEFCFPALHMDKLFLTTLISICKDYGVDLFMLCDSSSPLVPALRAQADNVICTERSKEISSLNVYIERYVGFSRPSQIWKCCFSNIMEQFFCETVQKKGPQFNISDRNITEDCISSMEQYWLNGNSYGK